MAVLRQRKRGLLPAPCHLFGAIVAQHTHNRQRHTKAVDPRNRIAEDQERYGDHKDPL